MSNFIYNDRVNPGGLWEFVKESNRIEGIERLPTDEEIKAHKTFLSMGSIRVADLQAFVYDIAPGHVLREREGLNVRVGNHLPPPGGPAVLTSLNGLLYDCQPVREDIPLTPWQAHCCYETLHPFTDGNGRSGRVLWAWMMFDQGMDPFHLGFLHTAYYQALSEHNSR